MNIKTTMEAIHIRNLKRGRGYIKGLTKGCLGLEGFGSIVKRITQYLMNLKD